MLKLAFITSSIVALDQALKFLIITRLQFQEIIEINSILKVVYFRNKGAAFSFLSDQGGWQRYFLIVISLLAVIKNIIKKYNRTYCFAGVCPSWDGNLYDRFFLGYVVDFILFHVEQYYWPAFNFADASISVGAMLLIYDSIKK